LGGLDVEFEWLARSGVALARYVLGPLKEGPSQDCEALSDVWAGGHGTNTPPIEPQDIPLGRGRISVHITDLDRKLNINVADPMILQGALQLMGVEAAGIRSLADAMLDWIDPDDEPRAEGAESAHYMAQPNSGFSP